MKAIVQTAYGSPDYLTCQDVPEPTCGPGDVLVKIQAASINYGDKAIVNGKPFLVRLMGYGFFKPKFSIPGGDIAGRVVAVGEDVTQFKPGDEVFGDIGEAGFGAFAEYVAAPADLLVLKPVNVTFEEAAAVCQAAVVALQGLRDKGQIQAGHKVLINGASGGVGTFAVQIAKAMGATVTAVCSAKNHDLMRAIGADHVFDYAVTDFTKEKAHYDLIFDIVANRSLSDYMRVLTPQGRYVACAFNMTALFFGSLLSKKNGKKVHSLIHKPKQQDLVLIKTLLENGQIVPVIDQCLPLHAVADGMRWLENGRHRGKVVVKIA